MNDNKEDKEWLYGKLKDNGLSISYEDFDKTLSNEDDRKWYYDKASGMGLQVGSYDDFSRMFGNISTEHVRQNQAANAPEVNVSTAVRPQQAEHDIEPVTRQTLRQQVEGTNGFHIPTQAEMRAKVDPNRNMYPDFAENIRQAAGRGEFDTIINKEEEDRLNNTFKPSPVNNQGDIYRNYASRFGNTERGKQLDDELASIQQEVSRRYADQYLQSPEYRQLASQYSGNELDRRANEQFNDIYGKRIQNDIEPYQRAYSNEVMSRYGRSIEKESNELVKKQVGKQLDELSGNVDSMITLRGQRLEKESEGKWWRDLPRGGGGAVTTTNFSSNQGRNFDAEYQQLQAASSLIDNSKDIINEASKKGKTNFVAGLGRGIRDSFNADNWSFGLTELSKNINLNQVLDKADNGEQLSESEQALLDALVTNMAVNAYYSSDLGRGYKAGQTTGASIPFMLEFAVNPVSASGSGIAKGILRYGARRFGLASARGAARKAALTGARLVGDAAAAAAMTGTTGLAGVASDTQERMRGDVNIDFDENGNAVYKDRENRKGFAESAFKSATSRFLENQSEMVFNAFPGIGEAIGKYIPGGMPDILKRFGNTRMGQSVRELYRDIKNNPTLREIAQRTQFHGLGEEYMEEVYNNFASIPLGDMTFEDAVSLDNNIDTFLGLAPTSVAFGMLGLAGMARERYNNRRNMRRAFGKFTPDQQRMFNELQQMSRENGNEDIKNFIKMTIEDPELTQEQKRDEIQYAWEIARSNAIDEIQEEEIQEQVDSENADIDAHSDPKTNTYTEMDRLVMDSTGEYVRVPGHKTGEIGGMPVWVEEGKEVTPENSIVLKPGQWDEGTVRSMPADEVKAENEAMIREEAAAQAEQESTYSPDIPPLQLGSAFTYGNDTYEVVQQNADGGWIANKTSVDEKGNQKEEVVLIDDKTYMDIMQANIDAEEAKREQPEKLQAEVTLNSDIINSATPKDYMKANPSIVEGYITSNPEQVQIRLNDEVQKTADYLNGKTDEKGYLSSMGYLDSYLNNASDEDIRELAKEQSDRYRPYLNINNQNQQSSGDVINSSENDAKNEVPPSEGQGNVSESTVQVQQGQQEEQPQTEVQDTVIPTDKEGNPLYYRAPVEVTVSSISGEGLEPEEVDAFIEANQREADKNLKRIQDKAPKMGTSIAAYKKAKAEWQEKVADAQAQSDYWKQVKEEIASIRTRPGDTTAEEIMRLGEPLNGEELAAMMLGNGSLPLLRESYMRELGTGNKEAQGMFGLFASKENGGMTIEEAGERLMEADRENGTHFFDQNDPNAGRNAIIDVLSSARTKGDLARFVQNNRERMAEQERQAEYAAYEDWCESYMHMTVPEYEAYQDYLLENNPYDGVDASELDRVFAEAEQEYQTYLNESENGQGTTEIGSGGVRGTPERDEQGGETGVREEGVPVLSGEQPVLQRQVQGRAGGTEERPVETDDVIRDADGNVSESASGEEVGYDIQGRSGSGIQEIYEGLSEQEASSLMEKMEDNAVAPHHIELNPTNWEQQFGDSGMVDTPLGKVKMGANQIAKLFEKGRSEQFGTIKPTLETPHVIIEVPSDSKDGTTERASSLLFVKTFIGKNGEKIYYFKSVTVKKDGMEVSVSSHYDRPKRIKEALMKGKLLYRFDGGAQTEHLPADVSVTTPQRTEQGISSSENKDSKLSSNNQEETRLNTTELQDGENLLDFAERVAKNKEIDDARHQVESNPTDAQKEAGNYKKGHIKLDGYDITIENPKGSVRSGVDENGQPWSVTMNNDYGYIRGTEGVDGDHIDVFLSETPAQGNIYVIDQINPETGAFDEHKVMYGFPSAEEARTAYLSNYEKGWKGLGNITEVSRDNFKKWLDSSHRKTKPFAEYKSVEKDNNDIRFRETNNEVSVFAQKHNLNEKDVQDYADYMRQGNLNGASGAFHDIRRKIRIDNKGVSLGQFAKIFSPIRKELYEKFGNIDEMREQYVQRELEERSVMEAARKRAEEAAEAERRRLQEFQDMSDEQLDDEYMKAVEANDENRMRDLVNEAARRNGYGDVGSEYQGVGAWAAPGNPRYESDEERRAALETDGNDVNVVDMAHGYTPQPDDYFTNLRAYGNDTPHGRESAEAINKAMDEVRKGKDPMIKVYRAVPKSVKEGKLRNGDWVTPSRKYAEIHGNNRLEGDYRIIEQEVPASQLWWDGNDINEWGFDDGKNYAYRNTRNNRKLNDLITRDDNGNIIPLSQRFNARKSDVRYRFIGEQGAARLDAAEEATTRLDMPLEERRRTLAEEIEDVAREDQIFLKDALGPSESRSESAAPANDIADVNERFNEQLDSLTEENADSVTLSLGRPSAILRAAGVEDKPMKLYGNKVMKKMRKHGFKLDELRNLPEAVANPIAVFKNYGKEGNRSILTELRTDQGNFLVTLTLGEGHDVDFNVVTSVFGKGGSNIIDWIKRGFATYINKEKALNYLHHSALKAVTSNNQELSSAANIVRNFENPILLQGEIVSAVEDLSGRLHTPVRIARSTEELPDGMPRRRIEAGAKVKGWFDPSTGEVVVYLPNATSVADSVATVLHEAVGHKGLRELFGKDFGTFLDNVYRNAGREIRDRIVWLARKNGWDIGKATEEYLASLAERGFDNPKERSFWRKVKDAFMDMLRKAGINLGFELSDNDLRYILWRSYKNLEEGNLMDMAEDITMRNRLGIGEYTKGEGALYRTSESEDEEGVSPLSGSTVKAWDKMANSLKFQFRETAVDYLTAVEKFQDLIEKTSGEKLKPFENAYDEMMRVSSKNRVEMDMFDSFLVTPLNKAILALAGEKEMLKKWNWDKGPLRELVMYVEAKHGIERNRQMAVEQYVKTFTDASLDFFSKAGIGFDIDAYRNELKQIKKEAGDKAYNEAYSKKLEQLKADNLEDGEAKKEADAYAKNAREKAKLKSSEKYRNNVRLKLAEQYKNKVMQDWDDEKKQINSQNISWIEKQGLLDDVAERLGVDLSLDYSGLSSVFGDEKSYPNGWWQESLDYVEKYEKGHNPEHINNLWKAIDNATGFTLNKLYETGLVGRDYVQAQKERFEHYIPLRGFADETAGDVYNYIGNDFYPGGNPVKTAHGRTSEAGNPFGSILNTAYSAISSGNKNVAKLAFYSLVINHDTGGLAIPKRAWIVRYEDLKGNNELSDMLAIPKIPAGEETPEWVEAVPKIPENPTSEEVTSIMNRFEEIMNKYKKEGVTKTAGRKAKVAYRTLYNERDQHDIPLFMNGDKYVITITGNPRVAQAMNGLLNPDVDNDALTEIGKRVQRFMSSTFTAKNPAFSLANLFKDSMYANNQMFIRENPKYWIKFTANQRAVFGGFYSMLVNLHKYHEGTLDTSKKGEKMFKEFMDNGGATGYTFVNSQEEYAHELSRKLKELSRSTPKWFTPKGAWGLFFDAVEFTGQAAELVNRFAAYKTSREMGRPVNRSIRDAKEITVNFNRKGAGRKSADKEKSWYSPVNIASALSQYGRANILFWNANMQGKYRFYKNLKEHPIKTSATLVGGSMLLGSVIIPLMNNIVLPALYGMTPWGSGDDDEDYYNVLTDWERTHNICIRLLHGNWLKIPLSPDISVWYGLGDAIGGAVSGQRELTATDFIKTAVDSSSPLSINWSYEGSKFGLNFIPTAGQPLIQGMMNVNFMGNPIYKSPVSAKQGFRPQYNMVYSSASPTLIEISRLSNRMAGGTDLKSSGNFGDWNPSLFQNLISGYAGGYGTSILSVADWIVGTSKGESQAVIFSKFPLVSRFLIGGNKDVKLRRINSSFYDVKDFVNEFEYDRKSLQDAIDESVKKGDMIKVAEYSTELSSLLSGERALKYIHLKEIVEAADDYEEFLDKLPDNENVKNQLYEIKMNGINVLKDNARIK